MKAVPPQGCCEHVWMAGAMAQQAGASGSPRVQRGCCQWPPGALTSRGPAELPLLEPGVPWEEPKSLLSVMGSWL